MNFPPSDSKCDHHRVGVKTALSHLGKGSYEGASGEAGRRPLSSMRSQHTVPRAIRTMSLKVVCRSSEEVASPVRMWSETVQIASARLPHSAAHP